MQTPGEVRSRIGEDRIREAFEYAASGLAITSLDGGSSRRILHTETS